MAGTQSDSAEIQWEPPGDLAKRSAWACPFSINGRFYAQPTTGVQRYAREVIRSMDALLQEANGRGRVFTPPDARTSEAFKAIEVIQMGRLKGHTWEQIALPSRSGEPILNLCNTGPALRADQVVCIHDANVFTQPDSYSAAFRLAYRTLLPWLARRASRITSVSESAARQLAAVLPISFADIEILPNGHEHALRWKSAASDIGRCLDPGRPFVLLLGSRARHKNAELVLGLAEALDGLGLDIVIAGGRASVFPATVSNLGRNVRELGVVSDDDLAFLYERALCLTFPSWTEGFGIPIVEAMALGCPVVSSNRASMPEVCGRAALLAAPDDRTAWLSHITALTVSRDLREELRGRGLEQVKRFSWTSSARGYFDLFGASV